jgi:hypothetical protein
VSDVVNQTPAVAESPAPNGTPAPTGDPACGPVGRLRLMPALSFGRRAAALAGMALPVVVLATSVSAHGAAGVADAVALGTTCCPAGLAP